MENDTNTISLDVAQAWAVRWRETSDLKGFLIPKEDITQLFQHQGEVDLRAYLGIDDQGEPKLMIVGVVDDKDVIDERSGRYIYDFTKPCPNTCDTTSPMFNPK